MDDVIVNFDVAALVAGLRRTLAARLDRAGRVWADRARDLCPVRSGDLQRSLRHRVTPDRLSVEIVSDVRYAGFVEHGGGHGPAQHFTARALQAARPEIAAILRGDRS